MTITLDQALTIYIWFLLAIVLGILLLIARFYQRIAHEQTYYPAFVVPIVLFGLASARDASINQIGGDPLADGLWFVGGVALIGLCMYLYHLMTMGR
ncbi:MAG: hypothetical protein ACYDBJ_03630 [Aggregatilineales bacterium]